MLKNWNHRYSNHNMNIKCVGSNINCIGFESIHYTINLDVSSSFKVFRDFDFYVFMYC